MSRAPASQTAATKAPGDDLQREQAALVDRARSIPGVAEAIDVYLRATDRPIRAARIRTNVYSTGANG